jgi:hypothetical protein
MNPALVPYHGAAPLTSPGQWHVPSFFGGFLAESYSSLYPMVPLEAALSYCFHGMLQTSLQAVPGSPGTGPIRVM